MFSGYPQGNAEVVGVEKGSLPRICRPCRLSDRVARV